MKRSYRIHRATLTLEFGDITTSSAEVLVSSDDYGLTMAGGVSSALLRAGGPNVLLDAAKHSPARLGDVVITTAGTLPAKYIFHAVTIGPGQTVPADVIRNTTRRALQLLDALDLSTIAFPAIGAGMALFSYEDVAVTMADTIAQSVAHIDRELQIAIYLHDRFQRMQPADFLGFFEAFAVRSKLMAADVQPPDALQNASSAGSGSARGAGGATSTVQQLRDAEKEREKIEQALARNKGLSRLDYLQGEKRLAELQGRRIGLLSRLAERPAAPLLHVSYAGDSEKDREWAQAILQQLAFLERMGKIAVWHPRMIEPGLDRDEEIRKRVGLASVVLVLVSPDYNSSQACLDVELEPALKRQSRGETIVVPVVIRPVADMHDALRPLKKLPRNEKAASSWDSADEAVVDIIEGVKETLAALKDVPG